jgi:hypothetical protein
MLKTRLTGHPHLDRASGLMESAGGSIFLLLVFAQFPSRQMNSFGSKLLYRRKDEAGRE